MKEKNIQEKELEIKIIKINPVVASACNPPGSCSGSGYTSVG